MRPKYTKVRDRSANEGSGTTGRSLAAPVPACFLTEEEDIAVPACSLKETRRGQKGSAREVAFAARPVVHQVLSAVLQRGFEWYVWRRQMGRNICSERLYAGQFLKMPDPRINLEPADDRSDRVAGCLVGLAVGDALGAPLEFLSRREVRNRFPHGLREMIASRVWEKGEYTDDTQTALLIAESLVENKDFIASDLAKRFQDWARMAKDVGIQTRAVVYMAGYLDDPEGVVSVLRLSSGFQRRQWRPDAGALR